MFTSLEEGPSIESAMSRRTGIMNIIFCVTEVQKWSRCCTRPSYIDSASSATYSYILPDLSDEQRPA